MSGAETTSKERRSGAGWLLLILVAAIPAYSFATEAFYESKCRNGEKMTIYDEEEYSAFTSEVLSKLRTPTN